MHQLPPATRGGCDQCLSVVQAKAKPGRKVRIQETAEAKPDLGLSYLEYLFSRSSTREHVLPLSQASLGPLHKILGAWNVRTHSDPYQLYYASLFIITLNLILSLRGRDSSVTTLGTHLLL